MSEVFDLEGVRAAAARGEPDGMTRLAALHANGIFVPQSWPEALELLVRAAAAGDAGAQAQLALLDGTGSGTEWAARAARAAATPWRRPPPGGSLASMVGVRPVMGILSPAVCAHLISRGAPHLSSAAVHLREGGVGERKDERTNRAAFFSATTTDTVVAMAREKIAALVGLPIGRLEPVSLLHYRVGEQFAEHYDAFTPEFADATLEMTLQGQRILTVIVYLNDGYEGGETVFPVLDIRYRGRTGDALAWSNTKPDLEIEPRSRHAGLAPTAGEKWVLSQWIRDRDCSAYWG